MRFKSDDLLVNKNETFKEISEIINEVINKGDLIPLQKQKFQEDFEREDELKSFHKQLNKQVEIQPPAKGNWDFFESFDAQKNVKVGTSPKQFISFQSFGGAEVWQ